MTWKKLIEVTEDVLGAGMSRRGGWSRDQLELLGVEWDDEHQTPFKGWKDKVLGRMCTQDEIEEFIYLKDKHLIRRRDKKANAKSQLSLF
ncbi:MAG: hypothetical protein MUC88_20695 [Planctomycetes bacterium]|jgi:hypothetical protein|nr:hypothetical protein [Planctomycetota bacterium]